MALSTEIPRRWLTVEDFHRMAEIGVLSENDRVELIQGELIEMTPIGSRHAATVALLSRVLIEQIGRRAVVWIQNPIQLGENAEPQPDLAVLRPRRDSYRDALPDASDALLIVEIADSSLAYDRDVKLPLYARYTIPEVWLVDLSKNTISRYSKPEHQEYLDVEGPLSQGVVSCQGLEGVTLDVGELLS